MNERDLRFQCPEEDMTLVKKSRSGLIVSPEVLARARARIAAGEDPEQVAFDVATEDVAIRGKIDNA